MTSGKFSKILVIFCIGHLYTFTYVCVLLEAFLKIGVSDQLIISNFAFFGTELVGLLILKVVRIRKEKKECLNEV